MKRKVIILEVLVKDLSDKEIDSLVREDLSYDDFRIKKVIVANGD